MVTLSLFWLTAAVPVAELTQVLPPGGRGAVVDVPDDVLDAEFRDGLRALVAYLYRPGGLFDGRRDLREEVPFPFGDFHSLVMGSRPWRVALWEHADGGRLLVAAPSRPGRILRWFLPDVAPRPVRVGGRSFSLGARGGVVMLGTPEAVTHVNEALTTTESSSVAVEFRVRFFDDSDGGLGPRPFLPVPSGVTRIDGRLGEGPGAWHLDLEVTPADGDRGIGPWGVDEWRSFLEGEGLTVGLLYESKPTAQGRYRATWRIQGIRRALDEITRQLEFWTGSGRAEEPGGAG